MLTDPFAQWVATRSPFGEGPMKKFCDIQSRNELADYLGIPRSKLTHILYVKKPDSYYTTLLLSSHNWPATKAVYRSVLPVLQSSQI